MVLDDMEDDDGNACGGLGKWSVVKGDGNGQTVPVPGAIIKTNDLSDTDRGTLGTGSVRGLYISGTGFDPGQTAALRLDFPAATDLTPYSEIRFQARSDPGGSPDFRVSIPTETTEASGSFDWGDHVGVTDKWGVGKDMTPFSLALDAAGDGPTAADSPLPADQKDLAHARALVFQVRASDSAPSFGIWIDDVVLIQRP